LLASAAFAVMAQVEQRETSLPAQPVPLAPRPADAPASPLVEAAARGDVTTVRAMLAEGHVDVNGATRLGVAPLHIAVAQGDAAMTRLLLERGADVAKPDRTGEPPLMIAARSGVPEVANLLLEHGAAVDVRDPSFGQTPLMLAVSNGHLEMAKLLIDRGADVNARTLAVTPPRFIPPSESPTGLSKGVGIVRAGWPEGRGKRFPAAGSKTPLLYATRAGHLELARLLLEHGANLELADGNGITPLISAILNASIFRVSRDGRTDHLAIANLLLDAGANVNAMDWYGETALWGTVDLRNLELGPAEKSTGVREEALALIERLLEAGADPNARTKEFPHERRYLVVAVGSVAWVDLAGQTPFLRAAAAGDLAVMRLLLERGADPSIATNSGTTALMVAAGVNWAVGETYTEGPSALLEAVKLTHELGNDVNAVNSMGIAAIHGAANRGANDVIEYLAANGARLDVADKQGRTPLDWAAGVFLATHPPVRKPETIALLERLQTRGADVASAR
jgi:ankyrin repeat protein